jgi:hypothetical protein
MSKKFEIYFGDLELDAQERLCEAFNTYEQDENWDAIPLAIIERCEEGEDNI